MLTLTSATDTKERPFKCDRCRSTFVRRDLLLRHVRTVHAVKQPANIPDRHEPEPDLEPDHDHEPEPELPSPDHLLPDHDSTQVSVHENGTENVQEENPEISAAVLMTRLARFPQWREPPPVPDDGDLHLLLRETLLSLDPSGAVLADTLLPFHHDLAAHLSTYFSMHHPFHPFIHLPTFNPHDTPRPLLLAIFSLGALPTAKDLASRLHVASKMMVNSRIDTDGFSSRSAPLWVSQTVLLNTAFAAWSGDPRGLEFACSVKSFLANLASGLRYELLRRSPKPLITNSAAEDDEWRKLEAMRRTYFAIYVFFAQLTAVFNFSPAIANCEPFNITLPCDEEVWNSTTALPTTSGTNFRTGLERILNGQHLHCSSFARRVLAAALYLECWAASTSGSLFPARPEQLDGLLSSFVRVIHADATGGLLRATDATWKLARMQVVGLDLSPVAESLRYHEISDLVHVLRGLSAKVVRIPPVSPAVGSPSAPDPLALAAEISLSVLFSDSLQAPRGAGGIDDIIVEWQCCLFLMIWVRRLELDMGVTQHSTGLYSRAPHERELDILQRIRSLQADERRRFPHEKTDPDQRLSVFVGSWWARHGASNVLGGWGIRSVLREAVGAYADVLRAEFAT